MDPVLKESLRASASGAHKFLFDSLKLQSQHGDDGLLEQPKSSEMLRLPWSVGLLETLQYHDIQLCMCQHDLRDPENNVSMLVRSVEGFMHNMLFSGSRRSCWHMHN